MLKSLKEFQMSLNNDCAPDTEKEDNYSLPVKRPLPGARQQ